MYVFPVLAIEQPGKNEEQRNEQQHKGADTLAVGKLRFRGGAFIDRNGEWRSEVNWLKGSFIANRNDLLLSQDIDFNEIPNEITLKAFAEEKSSMPDQRQRAHDYVR